MSVDLNVAAGSGTPERRLFQGHAPLAAKKSSPTMSSFSVTQLLPETFPPLDPQEITGPAISHDRMSSSNLSGDVPSVFDHGDGVEQDPTQSTASSPGTLSGYDLMPPPPNFTLANAERLSDRLFSVDHLNLILRHQPSFNRFTSFLNQHRPNCAPTLIRYLETRKAMAAVDYANAIAVEMSGPNKRASSGVAAHLSSKFEARSRRAVEELITDALPAYITHRLTQVVTELLVKEITGNSAPMNRHLVEGLAEVYCMTDPSLADNPIVYASEEFHNATQYGRDYVIGRNCRFLQGPKTSPATIARISEAVRGGQEICETMLNYRRDGSSFLNLVLVAPLYDNRGAVRYFIGAQVDVTNLIEGGKGLESFQQLLEADLGAHEQYNNPQKVSLKSLGGLGELLSTEEVDVLKQRGRNPNSRGGTPAPPPPAVPPLTVIPNRRYVGVDDPMEMNIWPPTKFGAHGRLPGVYQNFMLVRPWPSLRIIFTSAALRIPGLAQSRLLDRIGGPQSVRESIASALAEGARVTAKISWLTNQTRGAHFDPQHNLSPSAIEGKPRYIHCTPLLGSDGNVGVWMIVMVENEDITGILNINKKRWGLSVGRSSGVMNSNNFTSDKLFTQYRRREGMEEIVDDAASTFFVEDETPPANTAYAEYLAAASGKRSASGSRHGSRHGSRQGSRHGSRSRGPSRGQSVSPETTRREAKMTKLPVIEQLSFVDTE